MIELSRRSNVELYIRNNLEALEEILNQRANLYLAAKNEKGKYDFGQKLTPDTLRKLAVEVIRDTKDFLQVTDTPPAYISMFHLPRDIKRGAYITLGIFTIATLAELTNGLTFKDLRTNGLIALLFGVGTVLTMQRDHLLSVFDGSEKRIRMGEKNEVEAVGVVAHEYTHRLQDSFTDLTGETRNPIAEGHARGVQGAVANNFAQRYDNPAYLFSHIDCTAKELKDAYLFICRENGISPKKSLASLPIPKVRKGLYKFFGHHYSIGVAAMSIAEAQNGTKVYKDVIKNDVSFLRV